MNSISGFYGPGAWAAWFMSLALSWLDLVRNKPRPIINMNTVIFLLGVNWAAGDLMRHLNTLSDPSNSDIESNKLLGSTAAAFTVVWWGTIHAFLQALFLFDLPSGQPYCGRMIIPFAIGLPIPLIAVILAIKTVNYTKIDYADFLPALYWTNMESLGHKVVLELAGLTSICILLAYTTMLAGYLLKFYSFSLSARIFTSSCCYVPWLMYSMPLVMFAVVVCVTCDMPGELLWLLTPWVLNMLPMFLQIMAFYALCYWAVLLLIYIWRAYVHQGSAVGESCFFMPCAPQSLAEIDQAFALCVGLVLLVAGAIGPGVVRSWRRREEVNRSFRLGERGRLD
jgi:hypothetical protein